MTDLTKIDPTVTRQDRVEDDGLPKIGDWFWVKSDPKKDPWLGCTMKVGSNFAEFHAPHGNSYHTARVHVDEFDEVLTAEPNADAYIASQVAHYQRQSNLLMQKVRDTYAALGMPQNAISDQSGDASTALAVLNGQTDVKQYEKALVTAQKETLPKLFEDIKKTNEQLARWMQAPTMPMLASIGPLEGQIAGIKDRIFNISLYAGLTEEVACVAEGDPAAITEKLHVMQRRLYMDEECLLDYKGGGMEFKDIGAFDAWLAKPENRDRLLPFQRTLVAFRVRRTEKERDSEGNISTAFINIQIAQADRFTFLYIRNGDQLWRMACEMDFGAMIFPDVTHLDPGEPMMVKMWGSSRVESLMSRREYDVLCAQWQEKDRLRREWNEAHKDDKDRAFHNPHGGWIGTDLYIDGYGSFRPSEWSPFDHTNVYYDEAMAKVMADIKEYNRVALIIQGLFDRSEVLHPHAPVRSWTAEGFDGAIKLVYDASHVLYHGEKPDFEAYRKRLNRSLKKGSVVVGADRFWMKVEAERESRRLDNDYRNKSHYRPELYRPYGNPGPGDPAIIDAWMPNARKATFRWEREAARQWGVTYPCSITVPAKDLLNVSAYTPGDFKQFFVDPRTRAEYLKWAPLLLTAEDYYAKLKEGSK